MLLPSACLSPPHGTGDLDPRLMWPAAFEATGGGMADVEAALKVYLTEGDARAASATAQAVRDESARQWARYRTLMAAYERALLSPSSIGTNDGFSSSMLLTQIQDILTLARAALAESNRLLLPMADASSFVPRSAQSASTRMAQEW